jgi:hypothetical protein
MIVGVGFLYVVWIFLAILTIVVMKKAMEEPHDDH